MKNNNILKKKCSKKVKHFLIPYDRAKHYFNSISVFEKKAPTFIIVFYRFKISLKILKIQILFREDRVMLTQPS